MKVKIKQWDAVATWRWDLPEDDRMTQFVCDRKEPNALTLLKHCIMEWIKQDSAKGQCPMCRQKFEWETEAGAGQQPAGEQQELIEI
ncbi:hypothetical protein AAE478_009696 [Parahypoxylon ruwenzoriense]